MRGTSIRTLSVSLLAGACGITAMIGVAALPHGGDIPQAKGHHTTTHSHSGDRGFYGEHLITGPDGTPEWVED